MKTRQRNRKPATSPEIDIELQDIRWIPFENDILVTEEFIQVDRARPLSPERELMVAVLETALTDTRRCSNPRDKKCVKRFAAAEAWIQDTDREWIFSFVNCCEHLGIDPGSFRRGLLRWKPTNLRKIEPESLARQRKSQKRLFRAAA